MTDPNEALTKELAEALYTHHRREWAARNGGDVFIAWPDYADQDEFHAMARAILPIIARVRDEALEEAADVADVYCDPSDEIRALKGKP